MDEATLLGFGTCPIPTIQSQPLRGYEFTSRRVQHYCRPLTIFRSRRILPELPGKDLGAGQLRPSRRTSLLANHPRHFKKKIGGHPRSSHPMIARKR